MINYFWNKNDVTLRIMNKNDIKTIYEYLFDSELRVHSEHEITLPSLYEDAEKFVNNAIRTSKENEEIYFMVENNKGENVGYAKISAIDERLGNCDCTIYIFKQYRQNKYATNAYDILLKYIFDERRMHKVHCCMLEGNKEGERFLQKFNFKLEGARSDMFYVHGKYLTEYYFGLLEEEYREITNNVEYDKDYLFNIPYSSLGELKNKDIASKVIMNDTGEYFWNYEDITLRATTKDDYIKDSEILYDSKICRFYDNDVKLPFTVDADELINDNTNFKGGNDRLEFAIMNKDKEYVGCINLCGIDYRNGKFSLSILVSKEFRGKGYGTKAMILILNYAFFELRLNKLIVVVNDENIASATMMRKVGCKVEGVQRESSFYEGKYIDEIFFGVNKDEFIKGIQHGRNKQ